MASCETNSPVQNGTKVEEDNNKDHEEKEDDEKPNEEEEEEEESEDVNNEELEDVNNEDETVDNFVQGEPTCPIVLEPLPDNLVTGIEDDIVLFKHRAKLWHFEALAKDWVDRGIGNIHIVQSKQDRKKMRIIMWQEPTGVLVCHSWISKDLEVKTYQNKQHLMWTALDFSDVDDPTPTVFLCKFRLEEKAAEFATQISLSVKILNETDEDVPQTTNTTSDSNKNEESNEPPVILESDTSKAQEELSKLNIDGDNEENEKRSIPAQD